MKLSIIHNNRIGKKIILFSVFTMLLACNNSTTDFKEYLHYLSNKENGLIKEKTVSGINLKVKYLPTNYLVYNELKNEVNPTIEVIEETKNEYKNSVTFMMILGPDKGESFDITRVSISNYQEFAQRIEKMNFSMTDFVKLRINEQEYTPELAQMESTYGLEQHRKILFVFKAIDAEGNKILTEDVQFVYNDELFHTGTNKFKFKLNDIQEIPELQF